VLERPDLAAEPSLQTNVGRVARMDEIDAVVEAWTRERSRAECAAAFEQARLPHAPVLGLAEVVADPQVQASGMLRRVQHPSLGELPAFGSPLRLSGAPACELGAAPSLGEHTRAVLRERLGLAEAEIDTLFTDGVVA
jgi:crotonobetainyl-CoA:carnitine CoA-transferase CaiB-like acyl-CoA transferase